MEKIKIFDTTLRDGEQAPGFSMSVDEKISFAKKLFDLNVDVIEAGFPVSSPAQYEAVKRIGDYAAERKKRGVDVPVIAALARTNRKDIESAADALKNAITQGVGRIHTFVSTSPVHMEYKLKKTPEEVAEVTERMVSLAKEYSDNVEFSAEDATRTEWEFMKQVVDIALSNGATTINLPDTVGYATPEDIGNMVSYIIESCPLIQEKDAVISMHCHDDLGMAVANSLFGVKHGARQVECAINGIGERAGNASLEEFVMALRVRKDQYGFETGVNTRELYPTSELLTKITGISVQPNKAIVGKNAFAHESGIHQAGHLQNRQTYEIMRPENIGRKGSKIVLGRHSGKHGVVARLGELGVVLDGTEMQGFMKKFSALADGKKGEITDDELRELLVHKR